MKVHSLFIIGLVLAFSYLGHSQPSTAPEAAPIEEEPPVEPEPPVRPPIASGGTCIACSPGSYQGTNCTQDEPGSSTAGAPCGKGMCPRFGCTKCPAGKESPLYNSTQCAPCQAGSYSSTEGTALCRKCELGYFCPWNAVNGSVGHIPCDAGQYCPTAGLTNGFPCPIGYICPEQQVKDPSPCPVGFYCPNSGMIFSIPCEVGFFCPLGSAEQQACPAMFSSHAKSDSCSPTVGFFFLIIVVSLVVLGVGGWIWWRATRRAVERSEEQRRISEIRALIPEPEGPKYSGL